MMRMILLITACFFGALSYSTPLRAGTIHGLIKDFAGLPVVGATVYAQSTNSPGARRQRITTLSDVNGLFILENLGPGSYGVYSYKESDGYADPFFAFFAVSNTRAVRIIEVAERGTSNIVLIVGPKCAHLRLSIRNEEGMPVGGALTLTRVAALSAAVTIGVNSETSTLVPPVPLQFEFVADGYEPWKSGVLNPRSAEKLEVKVSLKRSH